MWPLLAKPTPAHALSSTPVARTDEMRALDRATIERFHQPGAVLMERAASAAAAAAIDLNTNRAPVAVLVGPGNNGGDGSAVARLLHHAGYAVTICLAANEAKLTGDAKTNLEAARSLEIPICTNEDCDEVLRAAGLWIDAVLGIGLRTPLRGAPLSLLERAQALRTSTHRVLAVDLPSGMHDESGACLGPTLRADATVTFGALKHAFFTAEGANRCGELLFSDIGIPRALQQEGASGHLFGERDAQRVWQPRRRGDHKTKSGAALVVAGAGDTPGAGVLSACACARSGAGLTTLHGGSRAVSATLARNPAIMACELDIEHTASKLGGIDAIAVGPGLTVASARQMLDALHARRDAMPRRPTLILDADALSALAAGAPRPEGYEIILTPHPGELARLLQTTIATVLEDIEEAAKHCARRFEAIVVAKGTSACVTDGQRTRWMYGAAPVLGSGGSGDVLTGIITALAARMQPFDSATLGAWVHAAAARRLEAERGVEGCTAEMLLEEIPAVLRSLRC